MSMLKIRRHTLNMDKQQANINAAKVAGYEPRLISGVVFTGNPYDKQQDAKAFDIFATADWHEAVMASLAANNKAHFWMSDLVHEWHIQLGAGKIHASLRFADALASACAEAVEGL